MAPTPKADSYVCGISDTPLLGETIGRSLDRARARWGDREALVSPSHNVRWTWNEFVCHVEALAAGFLALGLQRGERIGIWSLNRPEWTLTQFAAAKAGLILVTINPAYRLSELEFALGKVGCAAIVTATAFKSSAYMEMLNTLLPELASSEPGHLRSARLPQLRAVIQIGGPAASGTIPFDAVAQMGGERHREQLAALGESLQFDDPVNIQFTSGTTGSPKGVTLTHHNILNNGYFTGRAMRLTEQDRICIPVPLYHCFGMVMGNLASVTLGTTMVYPGEGFDPLATLATVAQEKCTTLYGVPTMFIAELDHPEFKRFDLSSLRTGIMAGAPCPIEVMKRVNTEMNMREVTIAYGMTETSPVSFQSATDDPLERRVSTVGRIHPHVEVKVVDLDGKVVPRGERGELCTRGYSVMSGYWDEKEKTGEVLDANGWMHTGDLAVIDDEGYCNIVGRIKDLVIRGGENLYPREIEEFLYRHPKIQDVQIFGVADARYGEELCAWVRVRQGETLTADEVRAFCQGQIAHNKIPRYIEFVDEFPMTVTGKIQKFVMRDAVEQRLGLKAAKTA
ncbi:MULTISPECIES: AMP-binding protein [unclassified Bradyrhizobium]|uniref:AMP-binding protein n=1 Tax=unclassified Bradyrhizobium TaxID=2631580 RepID=UPI001BAB106F|nr:MULTISPECIES: AMP-binding protein [unclassified Bradyrhizobium]MBR1205253.1 AMP-binding protein [Bradyrhizobium sp. AUGA SZCCT0124]MBR1312332.1 AMP-binding protein [Bradyrhizobium sp. AUGA SZCCT0051]MBR1342223.1 AMP-binding protein [Bradyrhizobium sp. AUGA SZCCT0105]MBR1359014.1 AMP-binding protein [Bradyrhizobium sp. AUGA SZCCT0045]